MDEAKTLTQQQQLMLQHQQQQQHQQQFLLLQQFQQQQQQQQQQQHQQQQHQQQQAISRFPSNIDAHLRPLGLQQRSLTLQQQQQQQQLQQQQQQQQQHQNPNPNPNMQLQQQQQHHQQQQQKANRVELEMAYQDAWRVCHPDIKRPFSSLEDACERLLPYHVVADYEAEEDDRVLDSDTTGQMPSRTQQWDHNIAAKVGDFTSMFEKQVNLFNMISRRRATGECRAEERLMVEQALLQDEKQLLLELRAEMESREKASRDAAEAKMRMAAMLHAEQARAEAQTHAEMLARAPMRGNAVGFQADEVTGGHEMGRQDGVNMDEMIHGWGGTNKEEEEPTEDFLNDENEPENGENVLQDEWREAGEFDLNTR